MKIYIVAIPHTIASEEYSTCAFTQKSLKLSKMMHDRGHEVVFMGTEGSTPECTEFVTVSSEAAFRKVYGKAGTHFYDIGNEGAKGAYLEQFHRNTRQALAKRVGKPLTEIICVPWGTGSIEGVKDVMSACSAVHLATKDSKFNRQFVVESGIGYPHTFSRYRVWESYAWMHFHWGRENRAAGNGWMEAVIPNSFDMSQFTFRGKDHRKDHLLYFGRLIDAKGVRLAIEVAKACGRKIKIVGQGDPIPFMIGQDHVEYLPPVGPKGRDELMGEAAALMCPTYYLEPFGGVAVEALATGSPAITTDWGVFNETVLHGVTGYRCRTFAQFVQAVKYLPKISNSSCRDWAEKNFSLDKVGRMYEEYFESILDLNRFDDPEKRGGFYQPHPDQDLDFLTKVFP
jgi:glycosyltransferase involved in cell wall biosynthesis